MAVPFSKLTEMAGMETRRRKGSFTTLSFARHWMKDALLAFPMLKAMATALV
jgi:hypothetical protein